MDSIDRFFSVAVEYAWGWPLIVLLIGGGAYLTILCRGIPFLGFRHAIEVLRGKWDDPNDPGEISHLQALSTALSATVGVSNIGGVAIAIAQGGPGAIFWMWVSAFVGMATKFFTCTLSCMYRQEDENGTLQGGPMYYIEAGLGRRWRPLAVFFACCGLVGCLAMFQSNQLAVILKTNHNVAPWLTGIVCASVVAIVILGGLQRIARFSERLVPMMCGLYLLGSLYVIFTKIDMIPHVFMQIVTEAFTGTAAVGGVAGIAVRQAIATGVKRAAFSNEAGIGTAPMAHGAAKTNEPVREGLVAMLGPFIDTIIVCSMTAFVILVSDNWQAASEQGIHGVALTSQAFQSVMGWGGKFLVTASITLFALSTMVGYSYYGQKCFSYLVGQRWGRCYNYFFIATLFLGAVRDAETVINVLDTAFALMALPNMIATILLAPQVVKASRAYFSRYDIA